MNTYIVIKNEFKKAKKNKGKLFLTLCIPVLAIIFSLGLQKLVKPSIHVGIVNQYNSSIGKNFAHNASQVQGLKVSVAHPHAIQTDMIMAKYAAIVIFHADATFTVASIDTNMQKHLTQLIESFAQTGDLSGFSALLLEMDKESMSVAQRSVGFIFLTLMVTCTLTAANILKDKEDGILKRYKLAPTNNNSYILGNFIFNFSLTLIQLFIITFLLFLFQINLGISLHFFFALGVTIAFVCTTLATFIVSLLHTELEASLTASSIALIISLLGGAFLPLAKMPRGIQLISHLTFTKWLITLTSALEKGLMHFVDLVPLFIILGVSIFFLLLSIHFSKNKFKA